MSNQLTGITVTLPSVGVSITPTTQRKPWSGESLFGIGVSLLSGALILFSPGAITAASSVGTVVGTATLTAGSSGTPVWSLSNNSSGVYSISSNTGVVTIISTAKLAAETEVITIHVTGLSPVVSDKSFNVVVASTSLLAHALRFSHNYNSMYAPLA